MHLLSPVTNVVLQLTGDNLVPGKPGYETAPTNNDIIHSVVLVINAMTFTSMEAGLERKLKEILREADARGL